jgi:fatty acid desaturase
VSTPWELCPRCHSRSVKVDEMRDNKTATASQWILWLGLIGGFLAFMAKTGAGIFVTSLVLAFAGIVIVPVWLVVSIFLGNLVTGFPPTYHKGTCKDCEFQWEIGATTTTAPSQSH